ncbi:MAG: hypothetical protein V5A39_10890 [Haloarculaceae archaeon]
MKRRALLAAIVPLTAGCFSGTRTQSDEPAETPTPTPDETPTETPTETPADSSEQTLSDDQQEAINKINTAQSRLSEAVYIYTGGVSDDLLEVSAAASEFDDRSVLLKLSAVQTAINEAQRAAVTTEQKETVESLREIQRFLTQATDLQAWLIEGHEAVADTYDAIDDDDDEETVKNELDAVERTVENASDPLEIVTGIDSVAAESTDAIGMDEYEQKQTQFEHEVDVLEQLHDALSTIQSARDGLDAARAKADDGDYSSAENAADRADETLDETVDTLEDLNDDLPSRAGAFDDLIEDVLALAQDHASEADDLHDQYD